MVPPRPDARRAVALAAALSSSAAAERGRTAYSRMRERALHAAVRSPLTGPLLVDAIGRAVAGVPLVRADRQRLRALAATDGLEAVIEDLRSSALGRVTARRVTSQELIEALRRHWRSDAMPPLVFLHIMKVGGTSLRHALAAGVDADLVLTDAFLDDIAVLPAGAFVPLRLLGGHLPYAVLRLIPEPYATMTVLRDPIERSISHYRHMLRHPPPGLGEATAAVTLESWACDERFAGPAGNYMARQLGHDPDLRGAWSAWSPVDRLLAVGGVSDDERPLQAWFESSPLAGTDDDLLAAARSHLDAVDVVGVTEHLDDVARTVARAFGLDGTAVGRLNEAGGAAVDLPAHVRRRLDQNTQLDRALYDRARERARELSA